ncbi:hypothetical protein GYMLUDRAFT_35218 [Collybiopsis luxurians FD-317 M1]|nr:hypothetical protein GYMLUDRAFT_35218 [Collybiopsis luxurians FD-317 M1]
MPRNTPERELARRLSDHSSYRSPRRRSRSRSPPDFQVWEREAVRTTALSRRGEASYQVQETHQLQTFGARRRQRDEYEREEDHDSQSTYRSDNDEEYVMMRVTQREQRDILRRRKEQDRYESRRKRRRIDDSPEPTPRTEFSGPSIFSHARGFDITGGTFAAVGRDQIMTVRDRRSRDPDPRIRSNNPNNPYREEMSRDREPRSGAPDYHHSEGRRSENRARNARSPRRRRHSGSDNARRSSAQTTYSGASVAAFASNFSIRESKTMPGSFSAVNGDQFVTITDE